MNNYKQLNKKDRYLIEYLLNDGQSIAYIAKELNKNRSTFYREIKRNKASEIYTAKDAQFTREINNQKSHLNETKYYQNFIKYLYSNFSKKYSSIDICVFKAKQLGINTPTTKTVYNWINTNQLKIKPKHLLRPRLWWKKSSKYNEPFRKIANLNSIPISFRPKWINNRSEFGHYEIDLIVGEKNSGYILTLVEILTRKAFAIKLENKTMKHTNEKFLELINKENIMLKSITKDNGMEFNLLHEITNKINIKLYTCNTYASCERGTNENFNGLMRREYPKSTNFSSLNDDKINSLLSQINKMSRITA
ncbi:hypothetical protein CG007_01615 [Mesoplasma entomophilum]|nr:IS30 family transposase [Mesoplasma entomophilum]AVN60313.1 hypothetical protein CG007_01615 [Mesoplasma entomophilum]